MLDFSVQSRGKNKEKEALLRVWKGVCNFSGWASPPAGHKMGRSYMISSQRYSLGQVLMTCEELTGIFFMSRNGKRKC